MYKRIRQGVAAPVHKYAAAFARQPGGSFRQEERLFHPQIFYQAVCRSVNGGEKKATFLGKEIALYLDQYFMKYAQLLIFRKALTK